MQGRKYNLFKKWCSENWSAICKIIQLGHSLPQYIKIKWIYLKCIEDLNVRSEAIKLLEENKGKIFFDTNYTSIFGFCLLRQRVKNKNKQMGLD